MHLAAMLSGSALTACQSMALSAKVKLCEERVRQTARESERDSENERNFPWVVCKLAL